MSRSPGPHRAPACHRGFTLVEVVIAVALLLFTTACATPLFVGSQRSASRERRAAVARRLAQSTLEHLRSMPFAPARSGPTADATASDAYVVTEVFPHADEGRNGPDSFVVLAGNQPWSAGTFVTRRRVGAYLVTTESRFVTATSIGLAHVPVARLTGYDSSTGDELPSGALAVVVRVSWADHGEERSVARHDTLLDESSGVTEVADASPP